MMILTARGRGNRTDRRNASIFDNKTLTDRGATVRYTLVTGPTVPVSVGVLAQLLH